MADIETVRKQLEAICDNLVKVLRKKGKTKQDWQDAVLNIPIVKSAMKNAGSKTAMKECAQFLLDIAKRLKRK